MSACICEYIVSTASHWTDTKEKRERERGTSETRENNEIVIHEPFEVQRLTRLCERVLCTPSLFLFPALRTTRVFLLSYSILSAKKKTENISYRLFDRTRQRKRESDDRRQLRINLSEGCTEHKFRPCFFRKIDQNTTSCLTRYYVDQLIFQSVRVKKAYRSIDGDRFATFLTVNLIDMHFFPAVLTCEQMPWYRDSLMYYAVSPEPDDSQTCREKNRNRRKRSRGREKNKKKFFSVAPDLTVVVVPAAGIYEQSIYKWE